MRSRRGFPENSLVVADSGNGGHVLVRIDLPNDDASKDLLKRCTEAVALCFSDEKVAVDLKVFNAPRIWKLYNTIAKKGDSTPERPHRIARLLTVPESLMIAPRSALETLAAKAPRPKAEKREFQGQSFDLAKWIAEHNLDVAGPSPWNGGERWVFKTCPWNENHAKKAYIVRLAAGAIAAGCQADSCAGNDWHALRDLIEPGWRENRRRFSSRERPDAGLPRIDVTHEDLAGLTDRAWDALIAGNDPPEIFRRGSLAARIEKDDVGSLIMRNLNLDRMRHRLARVAEWYRPANTDRPERPAMPPKDVVRDVLATPDMPLPILNEIVSAPVSQATGRCKHNLAISPARARITYPRTDSQSRRYLNIHRQRT